MRFEQLIFCSIFRRIICAVWFLMIKVSTQCSTPSTQHPWKCVKYQVWSQTLHLPSELQCLICLHMWLILSDCCCPCIHSLVDLHVIKDKLYILPIWAVQFLDHLHNWKKRSYCSTNTFTYETLTPGRLGVHSAFYTLSVNVIVIILSF